jgi:hypothetical protein
VGFNTKTIMSAQKFFTNKTLKKGKYKCVSAFVHINFKGYEMKNRIVQNDLTGKNNLDETEILFVQKGDRVR